MIIVGFIYRGSHFDSDNKVDKYRNSAMTRLYHKQHDEEPVPRISSIDSVTASSDKISEENIKERAQEYAKQTNKLIQSDIDREERQRLYTSSDELKDQAKNNNFSDEFDEEDDAILDETQSPLHILLYGRSNHRVDSYSVVNEQHQQHVSTSLHIHGMFTNKVLIMAGARLEQEMQFQL